MTEPDVAYVLLRFPRLTETFIAEEIRSIQMKGANVWIFSLLRSRDEIIHPVSQQLLPRVCYAPGLVSASLWLAQAYYLFKFPSRYLDLLTAVLKQPAPHLSFFAKRIDIFLKGVWLAKQLEHRPVELVHTHFAWLSAIAGVVVSRLLGIPLTLTTHAYDIYSEKNDLLRMATGFADGIVTISETNKRAVLAMNPDLAPAQIEVIHCGIDLDCFRPPSVRSPNKVLQITSVGSLLPKKGHEYLIRACDELRTRHVDFQCVVVGSGYLEESLKGLICELGLENNVTLAGPRSQEWIRERLEKTDMFVLACVTEGSGDRDGIPVSIMEAMAMGVPVISTPVSGIPELVRNEATGLLVSERDDRELAVTMLRMATDEGVRQRIVENGLDLVRREYDIFKNAGKLRQFFQEIIQAYPRGAGSAA